jgi:hypothetical protein
MSFQKLGQVGFLSLQAPCQRQGGTRANVPSGAAGWTCAPKNRPATFPLRAANRCKNRPGSVTPAIRCNRFPRFIRAARPAGIIEAGHFLYSRGEGTTVPVHDWTRVDAGLFHHFHQRWIGTLCDALNAGTLPPDYFALVEQNIQGPIPDVLTLHLPPGPERPSNGTSGLAVGTAPPRTRLIRRNEADLYAGKANRITVRHRHGNVVAVVEILSPGNKGSRAEFRALVEKLADLIRQGVHLLVIDLFPPGRRDPQGIHKALWDEFQEEDFELPPGKPLTLAAYDAGPHRVAYGEFVAVGDPLPDMPLFLKPEVYVPAPLEATYQTTWAAFPAALKGLLGEPPANPPGATGRPE